MLIATPHVSDQSLLLVAHPAERLSCFGRRSSSAMRCGDAFWLLVSRPTASQCSSPFRFQLLALVVEFECSFGKILRRPHGATATSDGFGGC